MVVLPEAQVSANQAPAQVAVIPSEEKPAMVPPQEAIASPTQTPAQLETLGSSPSIQQEQDPDTGERGKWRKRITIFLISLFLLLIFSVVTIVYFTAIQRKGQSRSLCLSVLCEYVCKYMYVIFISI